MAIPLSLPRLISAWTDFRGKPVKVNCIVDTVLYVYAATTLSTLEPDLKVRMHSGNLH